jgi:hypothetical protein
MTSPESTAAVRCAFLIFTYVVPNLHAVIRHADEVYEHLVFAGHKHVSIRSLPGMADRVVRLGSAGKTFSLTAWKVSLQPQTLVIHIRRASDGAFRVRIHFACTQSALTAQQPPQPVDGCK